MCGAEPKNSAAGCDDWLPERSEFELPVPVLELADDSSH
jgi:hypothetical protein